MIGVFDEINMPIDEIFLWIRKKSDYVVKKICKRVRDKTKEDRILVSITDNNSRSTLLRRLRKYSNKKIQGVAGYR